MIGDCTGHGIQRCWDESLSILPQFASKLHFWIQLIESWTSFEDSEESVWQRANRLTQGLFVFLSFCFFSSLGKSTSPPMVLSAAALTSPQVALCGCGVEDLARVPISASLHKQTNKNMPNASRTRCKDTDKIITRTVTDITATRNCQRFLFFSENLSLLSSDRVLLPSRPTSGTRVGVLLPLPKSSQWTN